MIYVIYNAHPVIASYCRDCNFSDPQMPLNMPLSILGVSWHVIHYIYESIFVLSVRERPLALSKNETSYAHAAPPPSHRAHFTVGQRLSANHCVHS